MSNNYEIIYSPSSMQDIRNILDYISIDNPPAAHILINNLNENIGNLSNFPLIGVLPRNKQLKSKKYRLLVVENYIVFYFIDDINHIVKIARVLSNKQNYKYIL